MIVLVMGVSGSGKTTIGRAVAERLHVMLIDADDHHPAANIEKMRAGLPLTDDDRELWLGDLCARLAAIRRAGNSAVLACSALSQASRDRLRTAAPDMRVVWLHGPRELIAERMRSREHFMPARLLSSQFEALEPPQDALELSAGLAPEQLTEIICRHLEAGSGADRRPVG